MRRAILVCAGAFAIVPLIALAEKKNDEAAKKAGESEHVTKMPVAGQATCPLSGKPVDAGVSTEYEGQKVLFCCKGCAEKFKADPMKHMPAVYKQVYPQRVQTECPVMGGEIDPDVSTLHNGERVYFCCKGCDKKFAASAEKYLPKLAAVSIAQVHCPISGNAVDAAVFAEQDGKKVYFCCGGCIAKYKADPKKFEEALRPTAGLAAYGKTAKDDLVVCPVCVSKGGAGLHKRAAGKTIEHNGMSYVVGGEKCAETFKADPAKYTKALRDEMVKRAGGADKAYTCSTHPDVVQTDAGRCPLCGMKLTPVGGK
ncbi:MAG: YHS domain-containing protein [Planctomycetes bacterium]|nr:YHS domain-containing protein [Planctomycetota bacterium]